MPLETISGAGRTSSREAGVTLPSLGTAAMCLRTMADASSGVKGCGNATEFPNTGSCASRDDIKRTSGFQGATRPGRRRGGEAIFAFSSPKKNSAPGLTACQEEAENCIKWPENHTLGHQ